MKRKLWGGTKPPFITNHIHVNDMTQLSISVVMDETPTLTIGDSGQEATLFFTKDSLDRTIAALADLQRGAALIGLTWDVYAEASPPVPECPIHGTVCRPVWHKSDPVG